MDDERRLIRLSNPEVYDDGNAVAFRVETTSGVIDVHCPLVELGDIFSFLGHLAKGASDLQAKEYSTPASPNAYLAPVPASGLGFQAGSTPDHTLLVMRLFGFDLAFEVPSSGLAKVADDLARTAKTLSADSSQRQ